MAVCPKCNIVINKLIAENKELVWQTFTIDENEDCNYDTYDNEILSTRYFCPRCDNDLFEDEEQAIKFLKDADDLADLVAQTLNDDKKNISKKQ